MPAPRPVVRPLVVAGLVAAGVLSVVGGLAMPVPGLVGVAVAGLLAGLTAGAIVRDTSGSLRRTVEIGALATAATIGGLFVVSGTVALLGGAVAVVVVVTAAFAVLMVASRRTRRSEAAGPQAGQAEAEPPRPLTVLQDPVDGPAAGRTDPTATAALPVPPVTRLSTADLGQEWVTTTAALTGPLAPAARRVIVERREATLDELERRDPAGFERWLAAGPETGSDPADYVRGGPAADTEAA